MKSFRKIDENNFLKVGIILIFVGALFGLDKILGIEIFHKLWPILTIILGIGFIGIFKYSKKRAILYIAIGEALILFSFLAFFCNIYSWNILIHLWPIFITFSGIITFTVYIVRKDNKRMLLVNSILLILISVYFYLFVNYNSSFWWTLLIIGGIFLILTRKNHE